MATKAAQTSKNTTLLALAVLAVCGSIAFSNSFQGAFYLDDISSISNNERIHELTPLSTHLETRRPLVTLSFAINYAVGEYGLAGYHFVNVAIHILAAMVLFLLVRDTLRSQRLQAAERIRSPDGFALAVAALWVVHPLTTQAVTYLVQRAESMMALFYLVTLLCYGRSATSERRLLWGVGAVLACAAAMACKGVAVTVPVMALLYDRAFLSGSWKEALRKRGLLAVALFVAVVAVLYVTDVGSSVLDAGRNKTAGFGGEVGSWEYLRSQPGVLLLYLRLALLPWGQCLDWGWPIAEGMTFVLPGLVIVALLGGALWAWRKRQWLGFLGAWFFVTLAPTSSFIPIKDLAFEHRMYLPLVAVIGIAMVLTQRVFAKALSSVETRSAAVGIAVVILGVFTLMRNSLYCDEEAMLKDITTKRPNNARGYNHLGNYYLERGRYDEAEAIHREALRIDPENASPLSNIGIIYENRAQAASERGLAAEAKAHLEMALTMYRQATDLNPDYHIAWGNMGNVLARLNRLDEALPMLRRCVAGMKKKRLIPWMNLCLGLSRAGAADAMDEIEALIAAFPESADARAMLAGELRRRGDDEGAVREFRRAAECDPANPRHYYNAGNALRRLKRDPEAAIEYGNALRLDPSYIKARCNLALVQLDAGQKSEAHDSLALVLRQNPNHLIGNFQMGRVQEALKNPAAAADYYRKALQVDPNHGPSAQALRALQRP